MFADRVRLWVCVDGGAGRAGEFCFPVKQKHSSGNDGTHHI